MILPQNVQIPEDCPPKPTDLKEN